MFSESDKKYLTQGTLQLLLCLLGSQIFCENLIGKTTYEEALPAVEHLQRAAEEMEAAYHIFTDGVEESQVKRLSRFCMSHRLALVPECDPLLQKVPIIMDWQHVRILVEALNEDVCKICFKDKDGVRRCKLREAIYDMGGEPDMAKAKINEWCEISRGIL